MVNWLGPLQLFRTGVRVAVATTLGAFVDQREMLAALRPSASNPPIEVEDGINNKVWVDYLADTGDGWNSTYSLALCLSNAVRLEDQGLTLPRGNVLLLGGDQVYPTPAQNGYRTRFLDPFRAASPAPVPALPPEHSENPVETRDTHTMIAIPGNHDWYDGLRAFSQMYCNGKAIGDWRTRQRTSYYSLKLPGGWWIWGLDLQLESAMDQPQREYFQEQRKQLQAGDQVVVCTPEPSWLDESARVERGQRRALPSIEMQTPRFRSLRDIEELLGEHLALVLAGDLHHYAHYAPTEDSPGPHRITCGGGGAFLHSTHHLPTNPAAIKVGRAKQRYSLKGVYPDKSTSRRLRNQAWRLPMRNFSFCSLLAVIYMLFSWILQSASLIPHPVRGRLSLMEAMSELELSWPSVPEVWNQQLGAMAHSPFSVVLALMVLCGGGAFTAAGVSRAKHLAFLAGALHGLLHLELAVGILWIISRANIGYLGLNVFDLLQVALFSAENLLIGGFFGGLLFGVWMIATNQLWGLHAEAVMSSQRIADYKSFLRMSFTPDELTIYPIKLERVCRRWVLAPGVQELTHKYRNWRLRIVSGISGPRFVPAPNQPSPVESLRLIEPPIVLRRSRKTNCTPDLSGPCKT